MTRPVTPSVRGAVHRRVLAIGLLAGVAALSPVRAQPGAVPVAPAAVGEFAVPDPKAWAAMSPADQAEQRRRLQEQLRAMTPEQRQAFRAALRERVQNLTPQERSALADQAVHRWSALPPGERQRLADERRRAIEAMSPAERRQWLAERRAIFEQLTPEERARLRAPLPPPGAP